MIDAAHEAWLTEGVMTRRVAAWCIDAALCLLAALVLKIAIAMFGVMTFGLGFALFGLLPIVPFAYLLGFLLSARAATPGQSLCGIVLRCDDGLGPLDLRTALIWTVGLTITVLAGLVWMLVALVTTRHRTLHDMGAGLVMVRARTVAARTTWWDLPPGSGRSAA